MFSFISNQLRSFLGQFSVTDKKSCQKFFQKLLPFIESAAKATGTELDDTLLRHIKAIIENDILFDYFYNLIREQFQNPEILCQAPLDAEIENLCEKASRTEAEAISPMVILSFMLKILNMINTLKK